MCVEGNWSWFSRHKWHLLSKKSKGITLSIRCKRGVKFWLQCEVVLFKDKAKVRAPSSSIPIFDALSHPCTLTNTYALFFSFKFVFLTWHPFQKSSIHLPCRIPIMLSPMSLEPTTTLWRGKCKRFFGWILHIIYKWDEKKKI